MKKTLQITNVLALGFTIFINYWSNTGLMNNTTVGEVSNNYKSLFTPAGYTFAIWGIIYLLLFGFVIFQGKSLFVNSKKDAFILKIGPWFVASCVFNSLWIFAWIYEYTGWSCVFIFLLLITLLKIVLRITTERAKASFSMTAFVYWPFIIYAGWVAVASIANVSTYLIKIGWNGFGWSQVVWAFILITIAICINLYMIWKRHMREFAIVGAWALVGIGFANKGLHTSIFYFAFAGAALLLICSVIEMYQTKARGL